MKKLIPFATAMVMAACSGDPGTEAGSGSSATQHEFSVSDSGVKTKNVEGFGGVIAESYEDSKEWLQNKSL